MIDNNISVLEIKNHLKNIKVIVVQNGTRFLKNDILSLKIKKKFQVDYYFTFNKYYSKLLSKIVKAKFISLGSIENNKSRLSKNKKKKTILFISDFDKTDYSYSKKNFKNFKNYYNPEFRMLPFIENFCEKNNFKLKILQRTPDFDQEYSFYSKIFKKDKWTLVKKKMSYFKDIDEAEIVVFIHSTLGYEALFRKAKIAGFCCRGHVDLSRCFGWPKFDHKKKGFFWTNELNLTKFNKILIDLINMNQKQWLKKSNKYIKNFSIYNYNNIKLKNIIFNL
jgi:surface carbohydrate biosynthesis protein